MVVLHKGILAWQLCVTNRDIGIQALRPTLMPNNESSSLLEGGIELETVACEGVFLYNLRRNIGVHIYITGGISWLDSFLSFSAYQGRSFYSSIARSYGRCFLVFFFLERR